MSSTVTSVGLELRHPMPGSHIQKELKNSREIAWMRGNNTEKA